MTRVLKWQLLEMLEQATRRVAELERLERRELLRRQAWDEVTKRMLDGLPPLPERLAPSREQVKVRMLRLAEKRGGGAWHMGALVNAIGVSEEEIEAATLELWCEGKINNPPR